MDRVQTGAVIEDGQTARGKKLVVDTAPGVKSEGEKLEDSVEMCDASHAEAAAESDIKLDTEDKQQVEPVDNKPTEFDAGIKTEPLTEEQIDVEVEEFYVKYKNL